uniref:Ig-like domain-containing protein n=1 Tax=Cyprinus carpio TaxID=7962 RepID=A0A8C2KYX4_CYPCA
MTGRFLNIAPPSKSCWLVLSLNSSECLTLSEALQRRIMRLTPIQIFILMCGFCSRFHAIAYPPVQTVQTQNEVLRGSDVSLRCDVPLLTESSTLLWEKNGEQISNTTLIFNNSAFIILHTVDEHSEGKYYCRLMEDGKTETVRIHTLNVASHSYNGEKRNRLIYRQSSSNSDVLLICKSSKTYESLKWTWEPRPNSLIDLIAFEKEIQVQLKGPIKPGIRSSTKYNSQALIFHISPVYFNYRGIYKCITETGVYTTITLHTIRVFVEPPDGVLRNQSVVLTCELSEVTGSVMLVWLRMEGNRGVLVKQQIMTEKNDKLNLTVNLSSYESDLMNWQCAVFTENTLRALASITNSLNLSDLSTETSNVTNQAINKHAKATASCVLALCTGFLLGALLCYCYKKRMSMRSDPQESEPVYINISQMRNDRAERSSTLENKENSPEINRNIRRNRYDNSYIRECNLRNHLFQQIQVPDLDITPQHYYENPRKREFCPLFIGSVLFKLGEYQTIVSRRKYIIFFKEQQMALSDYKAIS